MGLLDDKVTIITGAAGGIGSASVEVFLREGAKVVAADLGGHGGEDKIKEIADRVGGEAIFVATDVTSRDDVKAMVASAVSEFGRLDCAYNNAGVVGLLHPLVGYPDDDFEHVLSVNLRGVWQCLQEELAEMLKGGGGSIVNTSSGLGQVGAAGTPIYTATKHAVFGLTKVAALDHATQGIRVNAVLPGVIDTSMPATLMADAGGTDAFIPAHPNGRLGQPSEIAEAVAWLLSDRASLVTGAGFAVDGGYLAV
jgi:NAD(P)-dependent dehydrogenase (short-subunit alcohol dehydrogenase family)